MPNLQEFACFKPEGCKLLSAYYSSKGITPTVEQSQMQCESMLSELEKSLESHGTTFDEAVHYSSEKTKCTLASGLMLQTLLTGGEL